MPDNAALVVVYIKRELKKKPVELKDEISQGQGEATMVICVANFFCFRGSFEFD